jgi:hypothetical protein
MNRRNFLGTAGMVGAAAVLGTTTAATAGSMKTVASGTFEGRSNHKTSGSVKVFKKDGHYYVELGSDFSLDGGPDPRVGFGKDGKYLGQKGYLGALQSLKGKQVYAVPKVWGVDNYDQVFIWCEVAGVPLGVADIK